MQFSDGALEAQRKHEKLLAHLEAQKKVRRCLLFAPLCVRAWAVDRVAEGRGGRRCVVCDCGCG